MVSKYLMTSLLKSKDEVYEPTEVVIFGVMIKVSWHGVFPGGHPSKY